MTDQRAGVSLRTLYRTVGWMGLSAGACALIFTFTSTTASSLWGGAFMSVWIFAASALLLGASDDYE